MAICIVLVLVAVAAYVIISRRRHQGVAELPDERGDAEFPSEENEEEDVGDFDLDDISGELHVCVCVCDRETEML